MGKSQGTPHPSEVLSRSLEVAVWFVLCFFCFYGFVLCLTIKHLTSSSLFRLKSSQLLYPWHGAHVSLGSFTSRGGWPVCPQLHSLSPSWPLTRNLIRSCPPLRVISPLKSVQPNGHLFILCLYVQSVVLRDGRHKSLNKMTEIF